MFLGTDISLYGDRTAICLPDGKQISYKSLCQSVEIIEDSIPDRSLIFCICTNSVGSLLGYLSIIKGNHVGVMIDAKMPISQLNALINRYHPSYIWAESGHPIHQVFSRTRLELEGFQLIDTKEKNPPELSLELTLLLPTSGSTGSLKFVRLSSQNLEANARSIAEYLNIDSKERPITVLPMHYSFGLSVINSHLIKGASVLLTQNSIMEKEFWAFLENAKATSFSGVPYTYQMLKRLGIFRRELPSLKTFTQAGGKLNNELIYEFDSFCRDTNREFVVMYGQTEATARISYLPPGSLPEKEGSVGIAIPGGEISIVDESGHRIIPTKVGELVYSGDNVSLGYAESACDLNKGDEFNGKLFTGDLARKDSDGFVYIVGRKKRFLKIFGNRVNLDEVEAQLKTITADVACGGSDDRLIVFIEEEAQKGIIKKALVDNIQLHPSAFRIMVVDHIPKNSAGKILYAELNKKVAA